MPTDGPLSSFSPPVIPERIFYDDDGAPIDYGNRWFSPPEWSYSITRNLERFMPVVEYAEALIDHLVKVCDVDVLDDLVTRDDMLFPQRNAHRAVRLTPANSSAAPLTFVFFGEFYLAIHAGLIQDFLFPDCSCEACDATGVLEIERMGRLVDAVTTGRFQETFRRREHGYHIEDFCGGIGRTPKTLRTRVKRARELFAELGPWQPWPLRASRP